MSSHLPALSYFAAVGNLGAELDLKQYMSAFGRSVAMGDSEVLINSLTAIKLLFSLS